MPDTSAPQTQPIGPLTRWIVGGIASVAFVSLASVALPRALHVIPILALALAGVNGLLLGLLARWLRVHRVAWCVTLAAVLAAAGQLGHTLAMHRRYAHNFRASHRTDPLDALLARAPLPKDPDRRREMEQYIKKNKREREAVLALRTQFSVYLQERLKGTKYGRPTPLVAWSVFAAEVLVAGFLAAAVVYRWVSGPFCPRCRGWYTLVRRRGFRPPQKSALLDLLPIGHELDPETATVLVYVSRCHCLDDGLHVFYQARDSRGVRTTSPRPVTDPHAAQALCNQLDATPRNS